MKAVFLNSAKLDFDQKLDFSPVCRVAETTVYEASSGTEITNRVKGHDIVITKELPLGRELIEKFPPSVRLICEAGTGYDNIDTAAAREKDITVCNVPGYSTEAVAQLTVTFILTFCSSLVKQQIMLYQKNHDNFTRYLQVPHFEVQNKTLGVIGAGAIGQHVIKTALVLGMNVLVYSRTPRQWDHAKAVNAGLEELLQKSDFVTIHCPLTEATRHLINSEKMGLMKPSAFLINTARGAIIKETDLISALQNKQIAGVALDVQDPEPPHPDSPLYSLENVILTPHIGWKTIESRQRLITLLADNITAFGEGNPINTVS